MSIISISRDSKTHGEIVAKRVAEQLGFESVGRDIIFEAAQQSDIPEARIEKALSESPKGLRRLFGNWRRHLAFFRAAFFEHMEKGCIVYHGLAGQVFLQDVPGALKIRIVADIDDRVREEAAAHGLSTETAKRRIELVDRARREWTRNIYGVDNSDPHLYDLIINVSSVGIDKAVETIVDMAGRKAFEETGETMAALKDKALSARTEAELLQSFDEVKATCHDGKCVVSITAPLLQEEVVAAKARKIAMRVKGVREVSAGVDTARFAA
ncbi:AAA family ATPase [Desulfovibrio inopinatus]|uniref:cytidylate kinase-like family protein n=1 Tax=Desulfovibrio inopinatus TaxID=102109 RepID=UPI000412E87C|nr:cytidylate kinase-like family protein [Desulfovibrio inopinatus]